MQKLSLAACALAMLIAACGESSSTGPYTPIRATEGVMRLPLVSTAPNGVQYRLVGAVFVITGTESLTITDTSPDTLIVPLVAGTYSIQLEGDWHVERVGTPSEVVPVQLISPNPMAFSLAERDMREIRFLFKLPADGNANVGITVDEGGWITGTMRFTDHWPRDPPSEYAELVGQEVPFTISFEFAYLSRSYWRGLSVATNELVVQFGGPYSALLHDHIARYLSGDTARFELNRGESNLIYFDNFTTMGMSTTGNTPYHLQMTGRHLFRGVLDSEQIPVSQPFPFTTEVTLQRYDTSEGMLRGVATGTGTTQ
ncbi:hypothetical protein [Myxococcus xanthus]|uniref:hypothetical protein n=1 Tax=Myxococcus xanthus TaxID=34 RepID=UPI0011268E8E|nr:hypothetical protein [Myxococcus xanthus]QDE97899.1 hypothetical protein BHS05_19785 [Myxococcus xanthus]